MDNEVLLWRFLLFVLSGVNLLALAVSARALLRRRVQLPDEVYASRRLQLWLSTGFVLGCAYRSVLPVYDVGRLCMFDSWLSSVIVGRSVATVAELCFVAQWSLLMREVSHLASNRAARFAAGLVLPLIMAAELCSWHAVLTTSNLGHVIEESLWGGTAALMVAVLFPLRQSFTRRMWSRLRLVCLLGLAYVAYMFLVDVPMYWGRWLADEAARRPYLGVFHGLVDASSRWVVSHRWSDWRSEVDWMTLYFSVAVWLSISLVHVPALRPHLRSHLRSQLRTTA